MGWIPGFGPQAAHETLRLQILKDIEAAKKRGVSPRGAVPPSSDALRFMNQNPAVPSRPSAQSTVITPQELALITGGPGSYQEGNAFAARESLRDLRKQFDEKKISVAEYTKKAQPILGFINKEAFRLGGGGSASANVGQSLQEGNINEFVKRYGFRHSSPDMYEIAPDLGQEFEQESREATLPENVPQETRKKIVDEIPADIPITSDRGQIEREGIRQEEQARKALTERDAIRRGAVDEYKKDLSGQEGRLRDLATERSASRKKAIQEMAAMLAENQERQLQRRIPELSEQANLAGIFRSTGLGERIAREARDLTADTSYELSRQGLTDREAGLEDIRLATERGLGIEQDVAGRRFGVTEMNAAGLGDITEDRLGMQTAGLQRQFSLDDYKRGSIDARATAEAAKPQSGGKGKGEKALGIAQGVAAGAGIIAAPFTGGASLGLTAGASMVPRPGGASGNASYVPVRRGGKGG